MKAPRLINIESMAIMAFAAGLSFHQALLFRLICLWTLALILAEIATLSRLIAFLTAYGTLAYL